MEWRAAVLSGKAMFHDSSSESRSDSFLPVFPETSLLYVRLVELAGDQFDNAVCAFAESSVFVDYEGYEGDAAG